MQSTGLDRTAANWATGGENCAEEAHQVLAAAVDVDHRAKNVLDHGGALDVPPGAPTAPRALPVWLPLLRSLPQRKVCRVRLAGVCSDPVAATCARSAISKQSLQRCTCVHLEKRIVACAQCTERYQDYTPQTQIAQRAQLKHTQAAVFVDAGCDPVVYPDVNLRVYQMLSCGDTRPRT